MTPLLAGDCVSVEFYFSMNTEIPMRCALSARMMTPLCCLFVLLAVSIPARAVPVLSGFQASFETVVSRSAGTTTMYLKSDGLFGPATIAMGDFDDGTGPSEVTFTLANLRGEQPDATGQSIVGFVFDKAGQYMGIDPTPFYDPDVVAGIDPTPFRLFLDAYPPDPIFPPDPVDTFLGELDFTGISSVRMGSLADITGLKLVNRPDGAADIEFAPFSIYDAVAVPAPPVSLMILTGLRSLRLLRR